MGFADLAATIAADALARAKDGELVLSLLDGDLGGWLVVDRAGRPAEEVVAARRAAAAERLEGLRVRATLPTDSIDAQRAAIVAFVRLYDEGLVDRLDDVVAVCPSCGTVVDGPDVIEDDVPAELLTLRLDVSPDVDVHLEVVAAELLPGAVAVAVPIGHAAAGTVVRLPLVDRDVPVLALAGCVSPMPIVPAHDRDAWQAASVHGLPVVHVLGPDGVVVADGPMQGLTRYAARQAAHALLDAERAVASSEPTTERVERCRHCGSVTVPIHGSRWSLRAGAIEDAFADDVRGALVAFVPADARDALLVAAAGDRAWCLERFVPGGLPLPVGTCEECGRVSVEVDLTDSCGKCLGPLRRAAQTLDARFVAAVQPLASMGWPATWAPERDGPVTVVVPPTALAGWVLPAAALARHLAGFVPFDTVVVHPPATLEIDLEADIDPRVLRLVLLSGDADVDAAPIVAALDAPDGELAGVVDAVRAAADALADGPALAVSLFVAALRAGVSSTEVERVRAVAAPFVGD